MSEIHDGENPWQWSWLEIRLKAFCRSTIPQKQFIIIHHHHHQGYQISCYLSKNQNQVVCTKNLLSFCPNPHLEDKGALFEKILPVLTSKNENALNEWQTNYQRFNKHFRKNLLGLFFNETLCTIMYPLKEVQFDSKYICKIEITFWRSPIGKHRFLKAASCLNRCIKNRLRSVFRIKL